jgi:hypothetical protein
MVNSNTTTTTTTTPAHTPEEYICPLSHRLMTDPVVSVHGDTFQRDAILCWLLDMDNDCCPFSGKLMALQDIIPNYTLRMRIQVWMENKQDGIDRGEQEEGDSSSDDNDDEDDSTSDYLRKLGISEGMIEIDSEEFKKQQQEVSFVFVDDPGDHPIKEILYCLPSSFSNNKAQRFGRLRKALQKLTCAKAGCVRGGGPSDYCYCTLQVFLLKQRN